MTTTQANKEARTEAAMNFNKAQSAMRDFIEGLDLSSSTQQKVSDAVTAYAAIVADATHALERPMVNSLATNPRALFGSK